jgi:hypothetical protein
LETLTADNVKQTRWDILRCVFAFTEKELFCKWRKICVHVFVLFVNAPKNADIEAHQLTDAKDKVLLSIIHVDR